ncbi:MAG: hypothetical protein GC154_13580 [bacterium]|nr:hypothetical protein [bacterium]
MLNLFAGVWIFCWVWAVGLASIRWFPAPGPRGLRLAIAFAAGETLISIALLCLGLCGGLRGGLLIALAVSTSLITFPYFIREIRPALIRLKRLIQQDPLAAGLCGLLALAYALGALTPEREVDSLWYHLYVPLHYIKHGGWVQLVPFNLPSHYPMGAHLLYCVVLAVGDDMAAKAFTLCHIIPLAIALGWAARRYAGRDWTLPACVFLLACIHFKLPVMANITRPLMMTILLSSLLLWRALETNRRDCLIWAAVFCGMAMATKQTALFFAFGAQAALLLAGVAFPRKTTRMEIVRWGAIHAAIAWTIAAPWMVKSWMETGNPFFPALSNLFPVKPAFQNVVETYSHVHGFAPLKAGSFTEFLNIVAGNAAWPLYNADVLFGLGLLSLVLIPLTRRRAYFPWLNALALYAMFPLFWGHAVNRLFSESYGVTIVVIAAGMAAVENRIDWGRYFRAALLIAVTATFFYSKSAYLSSPNIHWYGGVTLTEPQRRAWLEQRGVFTRSLFAMRDWMHANLPLNAGVYSYNSEYPYYLQWKTTFSDELFGEQMHVWLRGGAGEAVTHLRALNVRYLLDGGKYDDRPPEELRAAWDDFKQRCLKEIHREGDAVLYRFSPAP